MTIDSNGLLIAGAVGLVGFLFQFYFKKIAKNLDTLSEVHNDLEDMKETMQKMTSFREEFLLMKKEIESAVGAINDIRTMEIKLAKLEASDARQWVRYEELNEKLKKISARSRDREHFFINKMQILKASIEFIMESNPDFKKHFDFQFASNEWKLPHDMHGAKDDL